MTDAHPMFLQAPRSHRWAESLPDLYATLEAEAKGREKPTRPERDFDRDFAWRVLRGGAVVGLRIRYDLDYRTELRIARAGEIETDDQQTKWDREVATFLKHFRINVVDGTEPADEEHNDWGEMPLTTHDDGKAVARFIQLRTGEVAPGKAVCHPCREAGVAKPAPWFPGGGIKGQNCNAHAFQEGRRHTERLRQEGRA